MAWHRIGAKKVLGIRKRLYLQHQRLFGKWAFIHINKCGGTSVEHALGIPVQIHDTACQRRHILGHSKWNEIFSFATVRNPFAKVVSHYKYRMATNQTCLGENPIEFNEWIVRAYGEKDPAYFDKPLMFAPCVHWLQDESGHIIVDFVAKLENIDNDWSVICKHVGTRADLPKKNTTGTVDYKSMYSAEARSIVERHFAIDLETFDYDY